MSYEDLIVKVEAVNPEAAEKLRGEGIKGLSSFINLSYLCEVFTWEDSKEGFEYWKDVEKLLPEEEEERV